MGKSRSQVPATLGYRQALRRMVPVGSPAHDSLYALYRSPHFPIRGVQWRETPSEVARLPKIWQNVQFRHPAHLCPPTLFHHSA